MNGGQTGFAGLARAKTLVLSGSGTDVPCRAEA